MLDWYQDLTKALVDDTLSDRQIIRSIVDTLAGVVLAALLATRVCFDILVTIRAYASQGAQTIIQNIPRRFGRWSLVLTLPLILMASLTTPVGAVSPGSLVYRSTHPSPLYQGRDIGSKGLGFLAGKVSVMPGFPVMTTETPGTYHAGPGINVLVGDITGDGKPDFLASSLANGPLYAWEPDGKVIPGWPAGKFTGAAYAALGKLSKTIPGLQVMVGYMSGGQSYLTAFDGHGHVLPGWPRKNANYTATPPTLADINGDGIDEIFVEEENWTLSGYDAHGNPLPGWPVQVDNGQQMFTPTIADIDGDGKPEIISASESVSPGGVKVYAWHGDGTLVKGFPISVSSGLEGTFPAVADVLGLGKPQLIFATSPGGGNTLVLIYSGAGVLLKTITIPGASPYGRALAIARLDNSPNPEIVVQTDTTLAVVHGDGSYVTGWPQNLGYNSFDNSSPVVGDVTGDGVPDIAITTNNGSGDQGFLSVYSATGTLELQMQLEIGSGGVPAMVDLLGNGRNDLLVGGDPWDGRTREYPKVWAFDFHGAGPYGELPWAQFGRGPQHHSCFSTDAISSFCQG